MTSKRTCYARCGLVSTTNVVCLRQHIDINVSLLQGNKISAHKSVSFMHLLQQCETLQSLLLDIMNTPAKCNSSTKAVATAQCQTAELAGQSSLLMQRWQGSLIRHLRAKAPPGDQEIGVSPKGLSTCPVRPSGENDPHHQAYGLGHLAVSSRVQQKTVPVAEGVARWQLQHAISGSAVSICRLCS